MGSDCLAGSGGAQGSSSSRSGSQSKKRPPRLTDLSDEAGDGDNEAFFTPLMTPSVEQTLQETREAALRQTHEVALRSFRGQNEFALRSPVAIKAEELKQKLESIVLIANSPMAAASGAALSRSP